MLTAAGQNDPPDVLVRVRVLRAFYVGGEPQPIGTELKVSARFAREVASVGKAELLEPLPASVQSACSMRRDELWRAGIR